MSTVDGMRGWARTPAGFLLHTMPGGHFAPHDDPGRLAATVAAELAARDQSRLP
jgi:surfactin synthase thioesterase subunit